MKTSAELENLATQNAELRSKITELESLLKFYEEQFRLYKHRQFGASSEKSRYDGIDQLNLFNEAEVTADANLPEPELVTIKKHFRKRKRLVNDELPDNLPVEVVEHDLPPEEQICPECGGELHQIGK